MPRLLPLVLPLGVLLGAPACLEPEERAAYWPALHATIIEPGCATASCHSAMTAQAGVDLSTWQRAYTALTGRLCVEDQPPGAAPGNFVFPGDPERSALLHMLRGDYRLRMPPDTALPKAEIALIEAWIEEGAPCE